MSKSKIKKKKIKQKEKKNVTMINQVNNDKALIVVDKKKLQIVPGLKKEMFKQVTKKVSLILIGTISIAYIILIMLIATTIFYVSHLKNGLIQKGVYINRNKCI